MNKKILIVDDEKEIVDLLEVYLSNDGYSVYKCYNGLEAMKCIKQSQIDLAILDIMLPDIDGFRLCQKIREKFYFPIIMLTAKIEDSDKIMGLTIGADDYITKPFNPLEVVARVKTQLRRYQSYNSPNLSQSEEKDEYDIRGLLINRVSHKCYFNDSPYAAGNVKSTLSLTPFNIVGVVNDGRDFPTIYADSAAILNFAPAMWQVQNANVYWHPTTGLTIEQIHSALGDILTDTIGGYWESAGRSDIGDTYDSVLSILQLGLLVTSLLLLFVSVLGQINIGLSSLEQRTHELLIRRAIGASRTNIVALVLGSQLILSIFVCFAAILISLILVHCIGALLPVDSPVGTPSYPISVAVVAVAVSVLTALLGGLLPALKAAKLEPALALR